MTSKCAILLCYWGGNICDGPEGVCYNKPPSKAIKVQPGIKFNELINQLHVATSIDKQKNCVKVICRYPSGFGKMMKYIPLPIMDDDDIEIMFQVLNVYQELSTIDLYLEVETQRHTKIARRTQKRSLIEKDASLPREISKEKDASLPTNVLYEDCYIPEESSLIDNDASLPHDLSKESTSELLATDVVSKMAENEDFNTISQIVVVNNEMSSGFEANDEDSGGDDEAGDGDGTRDDLDISVNNGTCETPHVDGRYIDSNKQVPSCFTSFEGIEKANIDSWTIPYSETKNDLTRELEKDSFKDKEELIRAVKLYTIRKHRQYEVVETCPTIWKIRCRLRSQCGCMRQLRACKRKHSGNFEITQYTGPHTCLHNKITQDHPNLDANLIAQETEHLIKEQPSISIPTLRAEIIDKLGYNPSYMKVWAGKQKARVAQGHENLYTPHVAAKLAASMTKASAHTVRSFNMEKVIFEVTIQKGKNVQVVNLEKQTCTCGKWEINKYPCSHVLSGCAFLSLNSSQYVQTYYSIVEYSATWASEFFPLPHEAYWPQSSMTLLPNPELKRKGRGRPRSTRLRNGMDIKEGRKASLCGICKQTGHYQKTCPSRPRKRPVEP